MTHDQQMQFKKLFASMKNTNLAIKFDISVEEVVKLGRHWSLGKDKKLFDDQVMTRWSAGDIETLRTFYPTMPNEMMALTLNRTVLSVISKACRLGLRKNEDYLARMGRDNVSFRKDRQ